MRFLVDNQLPPALSNWLCEQGHDAMHVVEAALERAADRVLWHYAASRGMIVVSKDEDFVHLSLTDPDGPALVWVRLGNCRVPLLLTTFERALPQIVQALEAGQRIIEVR